MADASLVEYWPALAVLAGAGPEARVVAATPVNTGQRNLVCRVQVEAGATHCTRIVKLYTPAVDRFFDHHYRREEKLLQLLNRWFGAQVPHLYGGLLQSERAAVLVLEDLGSDLLEARLQASTGAAHQGWVALGVELLGAFHQVTQAHYQPFYRTCQSIDLDRLSAVTFARRLTVALARVAHLRLRRAGRAQTPGPAAADLTRLARSLLMPSEARTFQRALVAPLLKARKAIVHNSFSPAHVLLGADGPKLIDYEAVAVGPVQIDLAEWLEAPAVQMDADAKQAEAERYFRARSTPGVGTWERFWHGYACAAAARCIDYAGTTALRHGQYSAQGRDAEAAEALVRYAAYARRAVAAVRCAGEPALAEVLAQALQARD